MGLSTRKPLSWYMVKDQKYDAGGRPFGETDLVSPVTGERAPVESSSATGYNASATGLT